MKNKANLTRRLSAVLPFAHLLGISAAKAEEQDDEDERKQRADESDEDYAKRMEELDEEDDDDDGQDGQKKPAKDSKKGKKAAADDEQEDEDDPDESEKDETAKAVKAARSSERARCAAIFKCDAAGVRPDMAAHLAFETNMSSAKAISMLNVAAAGGATRSSGLASRMSTVKNPNVGSGASADPGPGGAQGAANFIVAAAKKARGQS
ncbi:hypothetical protein [Undibacterium sp. SXout20W]|uniref:hypothetical protein n=1 Tax=Undibacterium sp. SXout20W TaxID=3413051 RepID=UPI003BEF8E52